MATESGFLWVKAGLSCFYTCGSSNMLRLGRPRRVKTRGQTAAGSSAAHICGHDGIGRHARFRFSCSDALGFESPCPHQLVASVISLATSFFISLQSASRAHSAAPRLQTATRSAAVRRHSRQRLCRRWARAGGGWTLPGLALRVRLEKTPQSAAPTAPLSGEPRGLPGYRACRRGRRPRRPKAFPWGSDGPGDRPIK